MLKEHRGLWLINVEGLATQSMVNEWLEAFSKILSQVLEDLLDIIQYNKTGESIPKAKKLYVGE